MWPWVKSLLPMSPEARTKAPGAGQPLVTLVSGGLLTDGVSELPISLGPKFIRGSCFLKPN